MLKSRALVGKEQNAVIWDGNVWEDPTEVVDFSPWTQVFITSVEIVSKFLAEDVSQLPPPEKINHSLSVKSAVNSPKKCQVK